MWPAHHSAATIAKARTLSTAPKTPARKTPVTPPPTPSSTSAPARLVHLRRYAPKSPWQQGRLRQNHRPRTRQRTRFLYVRPAVATLTLSSLHSHPASRRVRKFGIWRIAMPNARIDIEGVTAVSKSQNCHPDSSRILLDLLGCMAVGCIGRYGGEGKISCRFASPNLPCGSNSVVAN